MPDFAVRTAFTAVDKISPAFRNMESSASSFQKTASRAFMAVGTLVSGYLINSFIEAAASAERMNVAFGSVFGSDATSQMGFVRDEAKRLGLDLQASADAYKSIAAAAKGSAISNAMVKEVFIGVSEGAAALQLSSEQTSGALTALSQMISKGKVQAEELRGQLGERIPGAFQIAARAMNMTTGELDKFMSDGKLTAELFIPRFAAQMRKEFGPAAMDAANSFSAARNRFNNSVFDFKVGVGSVLLPALSDLMNAFMPVIDIMGQFFRENREGISEIIKLVPIAVGLFVAWKVAILAMEIPLMVNTGLIWGAQVALRALQAATWGVQIAQWALNASNWANLAVTIISTAATWAIQAALWAEQAALWAANIALNALTAAQWLLNAAMAANPIGLIIMGIATLIGVVAIAIRNWDSFGAALMVLFGPIGMVISLFKTLYDRWDQIKQAFTTGGIVAGLKEIGFAILDSLLYPIQQLLELIAKIPGIGKYAAQAAAGIQGFREGSLNAPNKSATELQAGNTNVNIYSNGTEAKAEVTPRKGATINMKRLGYQQ